MTSEQKQQRDQLHSSLRAEGFDKCRVYPGDRHVKVGCSQCNALVINGIACHELGCPNQKRRNR
jgi:hypothetical protein